MLQSSIRLWTVYYSKEPYSWYYKRRARANKLPFIYFFKGTNVFQNKIIKELQKYRNEIWLYFICKCIYEYDVVFFSRSFIIFVHWKHWEIIYFWVSLFYAYVLCAVYKYEASHLKNVFRWCKKYCKFIIT